MELTKKLAKKILKEAVRLDKLDDTEQELFDKLFDFLAPSSFPPIIDSKRVESFVSGVEVSFPGIREDIEYYLYEVPSMKSNKVICEKDGKKYNAKKVDEYAQFIVDTRI